MIRRPLLLALLIGAAFTGCQSEVDHIHPKVMHDAALSTEHSFLAVAMERGAGIRFLLPSIPEGSRLQWLILGNNIRVLEQTSGIVPVEAPGTGFSVTFFSLKPGKSVVRFALLDPDAAESVPLSRLLVGVVVKSDDDN